MGFFENLDAMFRRLTHTEKVNIDMDNLDKYSDIPEYYKRIWMEADPERYKKQLRKMKLNELKNKNKD